MHVRDGGTKVVDYEIASFRPDAPLEGRTYVPFWRLYSRFTILRMDSKGGSLSKLSSWVKGGTGNAGETFVFVPAPDFDPPTFKRLATMMTAQWPKYSPRRDFEGVPRLPASITQEEAAKLADFVLITLEAEKPGVLQELEYTFEVIDTRIVYLPFNATPQGLMPGL
jgi:hypothetical protein